MGVGGLHQQAAAHAFELKAVGTGQQRHFQYAHVFLGGNNRAGFGTEFGCHQHFHKLAGNGFYGSSVHFTIKGDDAAKGAGGVGGQRQAVGAQRIGSHGYAAGVGVFHNHAGGCVKCLNGFPCRIGIGNVVVRQFFALQLAIRRKAA